MGLWVRVSVTSRPLCKLDVTLTDEDNNINQLMMPIGQSQAMWQCKWQQMETLPGAQQQTQKYSVTLKGRGAKKGFYYPHVPWVSNFSINDLPNHIQTRLVKTPN